MCLLYACSCFVELAFHKKTNCDPLKIKFEAFTFWHFIANNFKNISCRPLTSDVWVCMGKT